MSTSKWLNEHLTLVGAALAVVIFITGRSSLPSIMHYFNEERIGATWSEEKAVAIALAHLNETSEHSKFVDQLCQETKPDGSIVRVPCIIDHKIVKVASALYRDRESVVLITATYPRGVNCHACSPTVSLFEFSHTDGTWRLDSTDIGAMDIGEWGEIDPQEIGILPIGDNIFGIVSEMQTMHMGTAQEFTEIYVKIGGKYKQVLSELTAEDDSNQYPDEQSRSKFKSKIDVKKEGSGLYDLVISRWGMRNKIKFKEQERFKFNGTSYVTSLPLSTNQ